MKEVRSVKRNFLLVILSLYLPISRAWWNNETESSTHTTEVPTQVAKEAITANRLIMRQIDRRIYKDLALRDLLNTVNMIAESDL